MMLHGDSAAAISAIASGASQMTAEQLEEQAKHDAEEEGRLAQKLTDQAVQRRKLSAEFNQEGAAAKAGIEEGMDEQKRLSLGK